MDDRQRTRRAMYEELAYDDQGQLLAASFMDYLLPTALDVPPVDVHLTEESPSRLNPLGIKGAGEGAAVIAGAALANAVADALGPAAQAELTRLPLTPERIVRLLGRA